MVSSLFWLISCSWTKHSEVFPYKKIWHYLVLQSCPNLLVWAQMSFIFHWSNWLFSVLSSQFTVELNWSNRSEWKRGDVCVKCIENTALRTSIKYMDVGGIRWRQCRCLCCTSGIYTPGIRHGRSVGHYNSRSCGSTNVANDYGGIGYGSVSWKWFKEAVERIWKLFWGWHCHCLYYHHPPSRAIVFIQHRKPNY